MNSEMSESESTNYCPTYDNLSEAGYLIVKGVLSSEECSRLSKALVHAVVDLVFTRQGFEVDPDDPATLDLLMDQNLREKKFGAAGKTSVWREGNTRQPLISKSCGMSEIHFNEELLETITYNERLYKEASKIMGTPYLVHANGPERFCIKARGSTDMPQHIDSNPFVEEVNYPYRIQSLVTIQIDTEINVKDSGTLYLLTYFHHYWDFFRELCHPRTGLEPHRFPDLKSRFFILPTDKKNQQHFDINYLPALKKHAVLYERYLTGTRGFDDDEFYKSLAAKGVVIPSADKKYIEQMDWTPIKMAPGDMVFWHQYLPHYSVRQRSKIPRICAYYNVFPVSKEWYGTPHHDWVVKQFRNCQFFYGVDAGKYPTKIANIEEYEMLKKKGEIERIAELSTLNSFRRRITGQESYFASSTTPQDVGDMCSEMIKVMESLVRKSGIPGPCPLDISKRHPGAVKLPIVGTPEKEDIPEEDDIEIEEVDSPSPSDAPAPQLLFRMKYWSYAPTLIRNADDVYTTLLPQLEKLCKTHSSQMYGKVFEARRVSCIFVPDGKKIHEQVSAKSQGFDYSDIPAYGWSEAPIEISGLRTFIEHFFGYNIDYVLCHIYRGIVTRTITKDGKEMKIEEVGQDYLGWHNDKEAIDSEIYSISLGATRRFQFRPLNATKGYTDELFLGNGDAVHMLGPRKGQKSCQKMYKHQVPPMSVPDLIAHIESHGLTPPPGRKTYESLAKFIKKNKIPPTRINLTFRQFEK